MKRTLLAPVLVFALLIACAHMAGKGWEKTVTLPSGEVVLDISGEWDNQKKFYGFFGFLAPVQDIVKFTQEGTKFNGVKQIGTKWIPKGTETIKGELDKDGFKVVYSYIGSSALDGSLKWEECKWEISENGNKVNLDCGGRAKMTLTRK